MIYLTGDVHSEIKGHWEQNIGGAEIDAALRYLEILKKDDLKCTLFLNGKLLDEEKEKIKRMFEYEVELGGHTFDSFGSFGIIKSYTYRKLFGCVYGPPFYQERDIKKTKKAFEKSGMKMLSWRTHAFGSNDNTFSILKDNGVTHVSDLLGEQKPFKKKGIIHLPINIPVDVNTISYGELKPENRNPFASCTKGRITPNEWLDIVKKRVTQNEKNKTDSVILIHPITMKVLDDFKLFQEIAEFLSRYQSEKISKFPL
jgi:peptidoglycan/xylan/chitin deacetylase (PgdA/CDA1 family)